MGNFFVSILMVLIAVAAYAAPPKEDPTSPPAWALQNRPAGAPLNVPAFDKIHASVQQTGLVKVIVRFASPQELPQGFQSEALIKDHAHVSAQQTAIKNAQDKILKRLSKKNAGKSKRFTHIPFMALEVDSADLSALLSSPEIDAIEEDLPVPPTLSQTIPLLGGDGSGAFSGFTGAGQTVAILDTGVDKTHPFLAGKVIDEACFSSNYAPHAATTVCPNGQISQTGVGAGVNCNSAIAGCDHGTHVAGIAAGNGAGFSGVAKDASVLAVQVFSRFDANCGGTPTPCALTYSSDYTSALDWVYSKRSTYSIAAVNMSLGGGTNTASCDAASGSVKAAIDNLRSAGIATVIATGNNGYTNAIGSPACITTAVSVGSTTKADAVASYSNSASFFSLLAPGSSIFSSTPGGNYASWNGTSMATPHVTGAWAVMKSKKVTATVDEVLTAFSSTGVPVTDSRNGIVKPRINVASALSLMTSSNVTLSSDKASPQYPGTTVVFTAAGSGGSGSYEYEYYLQSPGSSTWVNQRAYGSTATWSWNTTGLAAGTYQIRVWMRNAGTAPAAGFDTFTAKTYVVGNPPAATGVTLTPGIASPQNIGASVTFTAAGSGGSGSYDYEFYYLAPGSASWVKARSYSSTATWTWNTSGLAAGAYQIAAWVKSTGSSTTGYDQAAVVNYTLSPVTASGATLTPGVASPQNVGTNVTFTAAGSGGNGSYSYEFYYLAPGTANWVKAQAYSSTATWTWNTSGFPAGTYQVAAWVKSTGSSTAGYDQATAVNYTLSPVTATGATLTPGVASPQNVGTNVTFTAAGSGGNGSYSYEFYYLAPGSGWVKAQAYSSTATWTWNTSGLPAGTYQVAAWVKSTGSSTAGYDQAAVVNYTLSPVTASGATLTPGVASPQNVGTNVTFTAAGSGGNGSYSYEFYYQAPGSSWVKAQAYSSTAAWTWNTSGLPAGTYQVAAWVKSTGSSTAGYDQAAVVNYTLSPVTATGATLTPGVASPQNVGTSVTFTAAGSGGNGSYSYEFYYQAPGSSWVKAQAYSSTAAWTWNTSGLPAGTYQVAAWVKSTGSSTAGYDQVAIVSYTLSPVTATGATLTPGAVSPQNVGTNVIFTASGSGGNGSYSYEFYYLAPGTANWVKAQAYSSTATWTWNTSGLPAGAYQVAVWVKSTASSTAGYDQAAVVNYTLSPVIATGATLTPGVASPQNVGTNVAFTAAGSGGNGSYSYEFYYLAPGSSWVKAQAYSSTATWTWNTSGLPAGAYQVAVWVKSTASSTAGYDQAAVVSYTLN